MILDDAKLITQIETSKSDEKTENEVVSALKEAKYIMNTVKKSSNIKLYQKFQVEYQELNNSIVHSITDDRKITQKELTNIKYELFDIIKLAEDNDIIESKSIISGITDFVTGAKSKNIKEKTKDLVELDINRLNQQQAMGALEYLNKRYSKYDDGISAGTDENSISELMDKKDVNVFQERLINKILNGKYYTPNLIVGFDSKKGNYIESRKSFEQKIQSNDFNNMNRRALSNYLCVLDDEKKLDYSFLIKQFGNIKADKIIDFYDRKLSGKDENGYNMNRIISKVNVLISTIDDYFTEMVKGSFLDFSKKVENLSKKNVNKLKQSLGNDTNRTNFLNGNFSESIKNIDSLNPNHKTILIESLKLEIETGSKILSKKLEGLGWKKEKINLFLEKSKEIDSSSGEKIYTAKIIKLINEFDKNLKVKDIKDIGTQTNHQNTLEKVLKVTKIKNISQEDRNKQITKILNEKDKIDLITNNLSKKDIIQIQESKANSDIEYEKLMDNIIQNNTQLKTQLKELEDKQENNKINESSQMTEKKDSISYKNGEKLEYTSNSNGYEIKTGIQNERINISKEEFESIKNNSENLKNLLKFKETLDELNLGFIWIHRENFISKINNIDTTLNIRIDKENYINETELKKILNSIITLSSETKSNENNLSTLIAKLREISNAGLDKDKKNLLGISPIENIFINKGIADRNNPLSYFNLGKMKENYK